MEQLRQVGEALRGVSALLSFANDLRITRASAASSPMGTCLCVPAMQMPHPMAAHFPHLGMGLEFSMGAAVAAFYMARAAAVHFPCPPMAMPPGLMFGVPGQAMPPPAAAAFAHMATAPPEQMEAAPARRGAEADQPPVPVVTQGDQKLQHPK